MDRLVIKFDGTDTTSNRLYNLIHYASTFEWNHINHITFKLNWSSPWNQDMTNQLSSRADRFIYVLAPLVEKTGKSLRSLSLCWDTASLFSTILYSHLTTPIVSFYPKITRLDLRCNYTLPLTSIIQIVQPIQNLKILSVSNVNVDVSPLTLPVNLQKLLIRACCNRDEHKYHGLCLLSRSRPTFNGPRHFLTQHIGIHEATDMILRLIPHLNLTIESICFRHSFLLFNSPFDFSQFTQMKSLTFDAIVAGTLSLEIRKSLIANFNARLYQSLRTITSLCLEKIVFVVPPDILECQGVWVAIDRLLSLARFSSIQNVIFLVIADIHSDGTHESLVSLAAGHFPHCLAAGRNVNVELVEEKDALELFKQDVLHHLPSSACSIIMGTRDYMSTWDSDYRYIE
uniref:Uncharacterized protein n=1 Tax=Moniliophthora roreri TaxID=221103 RepID=A0A0W0FXP4_MONRR